MLETTSAGRYTVFPFIQHFNLSSFLLRSLHICRAVWGGLSTFYQEQPKVVPNPCLNDAEIPKLIVSFLDINAGFTLTDPNDPRYQKAAAHRLRFGDICRRAAAALRHNTEGEDHIDAVVGVVRAIDTFMLGYGLSRGDFDSLQKNYKQAREWVSSCPPWVCSYNAAIAQTVTGRSNVRTPA